VAAPDIHNEVLEPPKTEHYDNDHVYRFQYAMWKRSGGLLPAVVNLRGLKASVAELNTMVGITTSTTVQTQLNAKANSADLGTMSVQNANNVAITGGTIDGVTISDSAITLPGGVSSDVVNLGGNLFVDFTQHGTTLAAETTLASDTILGNTLNTNGTYLELEAWGSFANNANNKTLKLKFGSTVLYNTGAIRARNSSWHVKAIIARTGSATEKGNVEIISSDPLVLDESINFSVSENLTTDLELFFTGQGTADNDILQEAMIIRWYKA